MRNKIIEFTKKHIVSVYFTTTFTLSGILLLPYVIFKLNMSGFVLPQLSPGLTAVFMMRFIGSKNEINKLANKLKAWKVDFKWYIVAITIPAVILLMRLLIYGAISGTSLVSINLTKMNLILSILPGVLLGAIGEEIGWRGFLLPILQSKMKALKSGIILGILWGFYHIPVIIGYGINIALIFMVYVTLLSVVITWLYNNSNGSIIITTLFHVVINTLTMTIFNDEISVQLYLAQTIATLIIACTILFSFRTLSISNNTNTQNV